MKECILCIDRGQSSIKAAFFDKRGAEITVCSSKSPPIISRFHGWCEQDLYQIWENTCDAIRKLLASVNDVKILAVTVTGQGGGIFPIDESGIPVRHGILSLDIRSAQMSEAFSKEHPEINTNVNGYTNLSAIRWLKQYEPESYQKTKWFLGSKDWIRFNLTGLAAVDTTDHPCVTNNHGLTYDYAWLEVAGLTDCIEKLPPVKRPYDLHGAVTAWAARQTGIPEGTPVVVGAHDMMAASYGIGGTEQGHVAVLMGSMCINAMVINRETVLPPGMRQADSVVDGKFLTTNTIGWGTLAQEWFLNLLLKEDREQAEKEGRSFYDQLTKRLSEHAPVNAIVYPYLRGTLLSTGRRAAIIGLTDQDDRDSVMLAALQGICISASQLIIDMEDTFAIHDVWIAGGGAKNPVLCQMFADVLNRDVKVSQAEESACRGVALCALRALGMQVDAQDLRPTARCIYTPNRKRAEFYRKLRNLYREMLPLVQQIWEKQRDFE